MNACLFSRLFSPLPALFKIRPLLTLLALILASTLSPFSARAANPQVPQGAGNSFAVSPTSAGLSFENWQIKDSAGQVVATDSSPAGWAVVLSVSVGNDQYLYSASVTAPVGAVIEANYQLHHLANVYHPTYTNSSGIVEKGYGSGEDYTAAFDVVPPPAAPTDLAAYATGSGKITLYWSGVPSATGYNVYRGTVTGGENYTAPVNGTTPITTQDTGPGVTNLFMYSDTGLTDGQEYFYTVKAVYAAGESGPSNEDSDVPDPAAVPWDGGNPSAILSAFRNAFSGVEDIAYALRVVGPDNSVYDSAYITAQPPDGTLEANGNDLTLTDGTLTVLPSDFYDTSQSGSGSTSVQPNAYQGHALPADFGPYRRVEAVQGFEGVAGDIFLPTSGGAAINAPAKEAVYIYLGSHGRQTDGKPNYKEVDAGLTLSPQHVVGNTLYPDRWIPFMTVSLGVHGITSPKSSILIGSDSFYFSPDAYLTLRYYDHSPIQASSPYTEKLCLLVADGTLYGQPEDIVALGAASPHRQSELPLVQMKRIHAIAQSKNRLLGGHTGVATTGSFVNDVMWDNGTLFDPDGTTKAWTSSRTDLNSDGSYDGGGNANISWTQSITNPYAKEDSINITIHH